MTDVLRRIGLVALALVLAFGLTTGMADARKGGGFGSRGSRTWSAPPATQTAPSMAAPMQRTQTQPGMRAGAPGAAAQAAQPRRFGFGGGLMAGLLGAGLLGMLFGGGFFGGLAGLAGVMGLLLQVALIGGAVWLALRYFRNRSATPAGARPGANSFPGASNFTASPQTDARPGMNSAPSSLFGGGAAGPTPAAEPRQQPHYAPATTKAGSDGVGLGQQDYEAFERLLSDMQTGFGRGDAAVLRRVCTPEAASHLEAELAENERKGVINSVSNVKLVQGDLAEAWREGATDYATVAMRYAMTDVTRDRATGRVVDGDPDRPAEVTEIWTFRRDNRGPWLLSGIQDVE